MSVRFKAFLVHLSASAVIALLTLLLVFQLWYPTPLHKAVGVTHIFLLLLMVDVTLGPLLTLVVYKPGKKKLVFDLTVIVLLQLSALGYGVWTVAKGRPVWLVFNADRFDLVRVVDIDSRQLGEASADYRQPSWLGPRWVGATMPKSIEQHNALVFESITGGSDLPLLPNLYRPLNDVKADVQRKARPLRELQQYNDSARLQTILQQWPAANAWLPLKANVKSMTVLLNRETAAVIAIVDLAPWEE